MKVVPMMTSTEVKHAINKLKTMALLRLEMTMNLLCH